MDELTETVQHVAGLTPQQATLAVTAMLRFMAARLPSALMGELRVRLDLPRPIVPPREDRR